jgi:hypothetical protein
LAPWPGAFGVAVEVAVGVGVPVVASSARATCETPSPMAAAAAATAAMLADFLLIETIWRPLRRAVGARPTADVALAPANTSAAPRTPGTGCELL